MSYDWRAQAQRVEAESLRLARAQRPAVVHYVPVPRERWIAECGVNNQVRKPGTDDPEQVTCLRCLDRYTRPE